MATDSPLPKAFFGMHDRLGEMRVSYVSSATQQLLKFEPSDMVGTSAMEFISAAGQEYRTRILNNNNEETLVSMLPLRNKLGQLVSFRVFSFVCDNIVFNVCVWCPQLMPFHIEAFKQPRVLAGRCPRACVILERLGERPMGPRIIFASNTLERIAGVEASDIQDTSFLELVAARDVSRAAKFLGEVERSADIVLEHLTLRHADGDEVAVEVLAAGSDDGAILLCQQLTNIRNSTMDGGCLSLEEMISSDPETSDACSNFFI